MIADVAAAAAEPRLPADVTLREVHARADLERIAAASRRSMPPRPTG
jgi:hypothetical protein